ncbi:hypothetical protein [Metamycoplasma hyosynoviae]|uniref:hypothetical protein n=1 Tax=Metamycoplasma hyosynoviae TaxID=29559 RepID=UPI00236647BE|nr:hypothetical protein [Metamycoplasma hyosynoviae]MDD7884132.1 hypothetical protein [Metamycoplasma hyosynoviae]MDD7894287.1 hypothetical protein [Metamycoplasma hyosynoviae]
MKLETIKELLLIITPFIVTLGGVISALFVKVYNAKNNYKTLKEEITKLNEETQKRQIRHTEELAKRDIIIKDLKEQLVQALNTIELLKSKIETKAGDPYLVKLEASNEEYKTALVKMREVLKSKEIENENLKATLAEVQTEIKVLKENIVSENKIKEEENLNIKDLVKSSKVEEETAKSTVKATLY